VLTEFGVKIAPSTYYAARSRPKSRREVEDEKLMEEIERVYDENYRVYGARRFGVNSSEKASRPGAAGWSG
jgi:putative transposase